MIVAPCMIVAACMIVAGWGALNYCRGVDAARLAHELLAARAAGRTLGTTLTGRPEGLTLAEAYRVQAELTALRVARGEHVVGWKLGYTARAMREQMGIDAPNYGPLTDVMILPDGAAVPPTALQPRVEPEIALRLRHRLAGPCSVPEVLAACEVALPALEVVDSVWTDYRFRLEDNTADGSSAAWAVAAEGLLPLGDLPAVGVELAVDGDVVGRANGAAAGGHPAAGVAWLAERLGERGLALEPGQLVLTGGLTAAHPLVPGSTITARFRCPDGRSLEVAVTR
jgi:2-keto-4-pentenoate hydratase